MPVVTRAAEPERVADRDDPVADLGRAAVAERDVGQRLVGLDLQHRDIGAWVAADDLAPVYLLLSCSVTSTLRGLADDVVVGHDDPGRIDDKAGAERDPLLPDRPAPSEETALAVAGSAARRSGAENRRTASRGTPGDEPASGSSTIASARRPSAVTEMLTTAGDTCLTSGAKLCCCSTAIGDVIDCGAAVRPGAAAVAGGFWAHTSGDSASVAPRPNPSAAARLLPSQGWRGSFVVEFRHVVLLLRGDDSRRASWPQPSESGIAATIGPREVTGGFHGGLIRRNPGAPCRTAPNRRG